MDSSHLPASVVGLHDTSTPHTHPGFDYHKPAETLVFIASPSTDLPNKFEAFSPTLFKPRGSCITDFPRGGEYRIAVWGKPDQRSPKKFSFGIGLAERDVRHVVGSREGQRGDAWREPEIVHLLLGRSNSHDSGFVRRSPGRQLLLGQPRGLGRRLVGKEGDRRRGTVRARGGVARQAVRCGAAGDEQQR